MSVYIASFYVFMYNEIFIDNSNNNNHNHNHNHNHNNNSNNNGFIYSSSTFLACSFYRPISDHVMFPSTTNCSFMKIPLKVH